MGPIRKCPVKSCDYRSDKGFYNIPEHPVRRQAWINACQLSPPYNKKICYQHFRVTDFIKEITDEDIAQARFGKLKKWMVPTQNLPGDSEINSKEDTNIAENVSRVEKALEISSGLATV